MFGGAVTAVMINTPGSTANMVTMLDGYPMNKERAEKRSELP
ncbi:MAG: tripartite tricarboxylate transporter permease [Eisenbergiella sp.]